MIRDLCHFRIQTLLMQPKIQQLDCLRQQNIIQKELLSHFQAITTCSSCSDYIVMLTAAQQLDSIGSLLDKYIYISWLESSMHHASCNWMRRMTTMKPKRRQLLDVLEWMNTGWKSQKAKTRRSNSTQVIMVAVLPFLK
jgi:hypothetical protein